jgi:SSS family solute:Na+ symporter
MMAGQGIISAVVLTSQGMVPAHTVTLQVVDWAVIVGYLLLSIAVGFTLSRRAAKNTGEFFLSGRKLPWWIAGTSMVATTFAADTPLAVTELVAENGIAGNWLWWNMLLGGMLAAFFFARLWRRAEIVTDCEFVAIRYSGKAAAFLRGFRAVYIGIFMNAIVIAWVNLAMVKILSVTLGPLSVFGKGQVSSLGFTFTPHLLIVGGLMVFVALYSALAGLWGVSINDAVQFVMAMTGCIVLAVFALRSPEVGGMAGLKERLPEWVFRFTPEIGAADSLTAETGGILRLSVVAFATYLGVQWWSSWYPGAEPGGGGYIAQRMMSAKNERHALFATLWFNIAHYALRPWPWIIVALCSLVMYPELTAEHKGEGFVMAAGDLLPAGLVGFVLAAFLAAYMSTISTQLNWGCSYIINDLYRPFIKPGASERAYVFVSRVTTFVLMVGAFFVTAKLDRISDAWKFILECSGGIGLVLILRWFWWRINAFSEIAAMVAPFMIYPVLKFYFGVGFPNSLLVIVAWSTLVWLVVTFITRPTDKSTLATFYRKVHPASLLWRPVSENLPDVQGDKGYLLLFADWVLGSVCVLYCLFGAGKLILGETKIGFVFLSVAAIAGVIVYRHLRKISWQEFGGSQVQARQGAY